MSDSEYNSSDSEDAVVSADEDIISISEEEYDGGAGGGGGGGEGNDDDGGAGGGDGGDGGPGGSDDDDDDANGYDDEDDCVPPPPNPDDLSEFFESTLISTNEKEKQTKTQFTIFKDAVEKKNRRTLPLLSKYEKAKIIGVRAQQIAMGSPIYLPDTDVGKFHSPMEIAQEELRQKRTPLLVRRTLDSKKCIAYEDWLITDLIDPFEHL